MGEQLHTNICDLKFPNNYLDNDEIQHLMDGQIFSELQYTCLHWATHLFGADKDHKLSGLLEQFSFMHFLHWLEILSLIGQLEAGYIALGYTMRFTVCGFTCTW